MMSQVDGDNVAAALYPVRKTSLQLLSPVSGYTEPSMRLLPPQEFRFHGRHTLVLDLDETLVHASNIESDGFRPDQGDFKTDVIYDDKIVSVYVQVRPGLRNFLKEVSLLFEVVIFTASVEVYASAVIRVLDPLRRHIHHLLHRAHCTRVGSSFAKDLSLLHRPLSSVIIIDNSPAAYMFQPRNAIPCTSWFDDRDDNELLGLLPMLRHVSNEHDVFPTLDQFHEILSKLQKTNRCRRRNLYKMR